MIVRVVVVAASLLGMIAACCVFDAASRTALALRSLDAARAAQSDAVRVRLLDQAETLILSAWSGAAHWHAGANEALSGILFERATLAGDAGDYAASAHWAQTALQRAPVQPHALIRLALMAETGRANAMCNARACLERSWALAAMLEPDNACTRLRTAHRLGALTQHDPRLDDYMRSGVSRRAAAQCLVFLEPNALYALLARHTQFPHTQFPHAP